MLQRPVEPARLMLTSSFFKCFRVSPNLVRAKLSLSEGCNALPDRRYSLSLRHVS